MLDKKIEVILINYFTKSASIEEIVQLSDWLSNESNKLIFKDYVKTNYLIDLSLLDFNTEEEKEKVLNKIWQKEKVIRINKFVSILKYAAIFIAVIGIAYLYQNINQTPPKKEQVTYSNSKVKILPGKDRAILTLENGSEIDLENNGNLQIDGLSLADKKLVYSAKSGLNNIQYNYLTIPRGGQFFLQLADGTKVWLNADSKLKYPVSFIKGQTRSVELVYGEAYFDVSKSTDHHGDAFKVRSGTQEIKVLGTEFNIQAYKDENDTKTTLFEGIVEVKSGNYERRLKPGLQAVVNNLETEIKVQPVNLEEVVSWKNGYFMFDNENIQSVMRKISRWYDVEINYHGTPTDKEFVGSISRFEDVSEVLAMLELTGIVHFKIEGRRIIVMP